MVLFGYMLQLYPLFFSIDAPFCSDCRKLLMQYPASLQGALLIGQSKWMIA